MDKNFNLSELIDNLKLKRPLDRISIEVLQEMGRSRYGKSAESQVRRYFEIYFEKAEELGDVYGKDFTFESLVDNAVYMFEIDRKKAGKILQDVEAKVGAKARKPEDEEEEEPADAELQAIAAEVGEKKIKEQEGSRENGWKDTSGFGIKFRRGDRVRVKGEEEGKIIGMLTSEEFKVEFLDGEVGDYHDYELELISEKKEPKTKPTAINQPAVKGEESPDKDQEKLGQDTAMEPVDFKKKKDDKKPSTMEPVSDKDTENQIQLIDSEKKESKVNEQGDNYFVATITAGRMHERESSIKQMTLGEILKKYKLRVVLGKLDEIPQTVENKGVWSGWLEDGAIAVAHDKEKAKSSARDVWIEQEKEQEFFDESKVNEITKDYSYDQLECLKCGYTKKISYYTGEVRLCPKCKVELVPSQSKSKERQVGKKYDRFGRKRESKEEIKTWLAWIIPEGAIELNGVGISTKAFSKKHATERILTEYGQATDIKHLVVEELNVDTGDLLSAIQSEESKEIYEALRELIPEIPGLSREDQQLLLAAIDKGDIPDRTPGYGQMLNRMIDIGAAEKLSPEEISDILSRGKGFADRADVAAEYVKTVLLPQVKSKTGEQVEKKKSTKVEKKLTEVKSKKKELYICNECCKTFRNNESICTHCKGKDVEKVVEEFEFKEQKDVLVRITEGEGEYSDLSDDALITAYNVLMKKVETDAGNFVYSKELGKVFVEIKKRGLEDKVLESKLKEQKDVLVRITGGEDKGKLGVVKNWVKGLGYQTVYFEGRKKQVSYDYLRVGGKTAKEFDEEMAESKLKESVDKYVEMGMNFLHDKNYDVSKVMDALMSKYGGDLSNEEWKEVERQLVSYLDGMDESKLKEAEETFRTVAKSIEDKGTADKLAREKRGQVVSDPDEPEKFMVIVKETKDG